MQKLMIAPTDINNIQEITRHTNMHAKIKGYYM